MYVYICMYVNIHMCIYTYICRANSIYIYICVYVYTYVYIHVDRCPANPTWGDTWGRKCHLIFECRFKAQSSNVSFHWNVAKETLELWALIFETAFENVTPSEIGCTHEEVHGSPRTYQTRFHGSPQHFKLISSWVNGVPGNQKILRENRKIWRCKYLKSDLLRAWIRTYQLFKRVSSKTGESGDPNIWSLISSVRDTCIWVDIDSSSRGRASSYGSRWRPSQQRIKMQVCIYIHMCIYIYMNVLTRKRGRQVKGEPMAYMYVRK